MAWTDERVEILKKLWAEGFSCSQIAMRLGRVSRNAVIGKVSRLGLADRVTVVSKKGQRPSINSRPRITPDRARFPSFDADTKSLASVEARSAKDDIGRVTFDELAESHCRYVVGDVRTAYKFCGAEKVPGLPYCGDHAARCYAQPQMRTPHRGPVDEALNPANDLEPAMKETVE